MRPVNKGLQEGVHKKVGCECHLQTCSYKLILGLMVNEGNKQKGRAK